MAKQRHIVFAFQKHHIAGRFASFPRRREARPRVLGRDLCGDVKVPG